MPTSPSAGWAEPAPLPPRPEADQELVVLHEDAGTHGPGGQEHGGRAAGTPSTAGSGAVRTSTVRPSTTGSIGLLLAGRYRLDERRGRDGDSSAWDGHDTQLERRVLVRVVSGRSVPPALEGARVAAAHHAPGLTRILDTGSARATDGTVLGWVVEERPPGDRLDDLVREAPLDAARSRAVVGQAAMALAEAARAGCHHRLLTPASLYVSGSSAVVSGLVVAAAAAGLEPAPEDAALAEDGRGLASLLYAALTGFWPHDSAGPAGAQPRSEGAAAPLHVLLPDVPLDLDALVSAALSGSGAHGPTPQTLADSLLGGGGARARASVVSASTEEAERGATDGPVTISLPETRQVPSQARHSPTPAAADPVAAGGDPLTGPESTALTSPAGPVPSAPAATAPTPATGTGGGGHARRGSRRAAREARADLEAQDREPAARLRGGVGSLGVAAGTAAGTALTRSRRAVRSAVASSPPPSASAAAPGGTSSAAGGSRADGAGAAPSAAGAQRDGADATSGLPLIEEIAGDDAQRGPSHLRGATAAIALALVAVLLVVIGIIAFRQVPTLQNISDAVLGGDQRITAPAPGSTSDEEAPDSGPEASAAAPAPVVSGVRALDPQGDGSENDDLAGDVVDGDTSTSWRSENYATAALGNLKDGVGVVLDLETAAAVDEVDLVVAGSGGEVEIRTSPDGAFEGSTVIAQGPAGGATTLTLDPPATTSHVIVWFTTLPSAAGNFTADLSEVTLR